MDLTNDEVLKILKIIDESQYNEVRLEIGGLKLHVQKEGGQIESASPLNPPLAQSSLLAAPEPGLASANAHAPLPVAPAEASAIKPDQDATIPEGMMAVHAPVLGIFYRASSPGEKPFVDVGQKVEADDTLCLIEVMKLFNSVKAGIKGTITRILAENGMMVEHGQVLIFIKPDA